jgi:hypothetical protein
MEHSPKKLSPLPLAWKEIKEKEYLAINQKICIGRSAGLSGTTLDWIKIENMQSCLYTT